MIRCDSLSRRIGDRWLLKDVSLDVPSGKVMSIVGPSGCGKTTLLRLLALLDSPDEGLVEVAGRTFPRGVNGDRSIYPDVTLVAQSYPLWPHLTLEQQFRLFSREAADSVRELLQELGMTELLQREPGRLSAGQRQRAALALALGTRPKVLLLDEITAAQDIEHCEVIAKLILSLAKSGMTVILSTHLIQFAKTVSDQFAFLDHGKLVEHGSKSQLESPKTERLRKFLYLS
jgi:polar amino acid transport system ATP-binding protein